MKQLLCLITAVFTTMFFPGAVRADDNREEKPRFKGVELYSWKANGGDWVFVLLDGTNARKSKERVMGAKDLIKGDANLKMSLARLAVGEQVFWTHPIQGFEFPPQAMQAELKKAAKEAKIDLHVSGQNK